jgi:site-specific recombinase XerD
MPRLRRKRVGGFRSSFRSAAERARLPEGFRAHDLRHRRVTSWLADGKPATLVKEAVDHADHRTTMLYRHLAREHLRALVTPFVLVKDQESKPTRAG